MANLDHDAPKDRPDGPGKPAALDAVVVPDDDAPLDRPFEVVGPPPGSEVAFVFESRLFDVPGLYFAMTADLREPAAYIPMGGHTACLTLPKLGDAFGIDPLSADGVMLGRVAAGLDHVRRITPGERIPLEVLDGTASWAVEDRHRELARGRLCVRLATAVPALRQLASPQADPGNLGRSAAAGPLLDAAALQIEARRTDRPVGEIGNPGPSRTALDDVEHETSYIEALREMLACVPRIHKQIGAARQVFHSDAEMGDNVVMMQALSRRSVDRVRTLLTEADRCFDDPIAAVVNWPSTRETVREARNALHRMSLDWGILEPDWRQPPSDPTALAALMRVTYHFLALRHTNERVWAKPTVF